MARGNRFDRDLVEVHPVYVMRYHGKILFLAVLLLWVFFTDGAGGDPGQVFSHRLHPCAPKSTRGTDRARANTGMVAWFDGSTLRFEHWLDTYCNAGEHLEVKITLVERVITVKETYSGEPVRCRCVFRISGEAKNLRRGNYTIRAVFDNKYAKTQSVIEETEIAVP